MNAHSKIIRKDIFLVFTLKLMFFLGLTSAQANNFGFEDLTKSEFRSVVKEFGAGYSHTAVSSAAGLGKIFGFEVGILGAGTQSKEVDKLAQRFDSKAELETLPSAALYGAVTFPLGITGEINFLPQIDAEEFEFKTGSLAAKWTPTDIWSLPVDLSLKLHLATTSVEWSQKISSVDTKIEYEQVVTGLLFQVSRKFAVFEPYIGVGSIRSKGELDVKGSGTIFDNTYTTASRADETVKSVQSALGINLNFAFIKFGAEVGRTFSANRAAIKASLYF